MTALNLDSASIGDIEIISNSGVVYISDLTLFNNL